MAREESDMTRRNTRTYGIGGVSYGFATDAFRDLLHERATSTGQTMRATQAVLADAVAVSASTAHAWYVGQNAPADVHVVIDVARFLHVAPVTLLETRGHGMSERLTERQTESVDRIWRALVGDLLPAVDATCSRDGFEAWFMPEAMREHVKMTKGPEVAQFVGVLSRHGGPHGIARMLREEWVWLGTHPIYDELAAIVYGPLEDLYAHPCETGWTLVTSDGDVTRKLVLDLRDCRCDVAEALSRREYGTSTRPAEVLKMVQDVIARYV